MPDPRDPPPTEEGWYALHDFRTIDWDAWRDVPERERERALDDAIDHFESVLAVEDATEGASALYSILGHKADFLVLHLRPSSADVGALERRFETTEFAAFTDRVTSFVSVTEASGYSERAREYFEGDLDENSGLANYIHTRLEPTVPDATHVCFYPMDKRRDPDQNWYDLPFEDRADHMEAHGDIGRDYGGRVTQMITGAIALDDWEWGVTLWGDALTDMKDLLYEMRFDPSTSKFAEFGSFYVGRRFPPADLPSLLSGDRVPSDADATDHTETGPAHPDEAASETREDRPDHDASGDGTTDEQAATGTAASRPPAAGGGPPGGDGDSPLEPADPEDIARRLVPLGFQEGDYDPGDYALVFRSEANAQELAGEVDGLRGDFDHYDSHVETVVRANDGRSVVVSIWDSERAADIAEGFLTDLSGMTDGVRGPVPGGSDGQTTDDDPDVASHASGSSRSIREDLADLDIYAGQPHGEDLYALVLYSEAPTDELRDEVADLRNGFDRYDTHEGTAVYRDPDSDTSAVVSLWATQDAADTASGYLADVSGVVGWADEGEGFGTMGMFYTVKPEHREEFVETFATVGDVLAEMDGHRETSLLVNVDDENDMFIASQWDSREDAMGFFRSEEFADTVSWGRDVLADTPRHVFLA